MHNNAIFPFLNITLLGPRHSQFVNSMIAQYENGKNPPQTSPQPDPETKRKTATFWGSLQLPELSRGLDKG